MPVCPLSAAILKDQYLPDDERDLQKILQEVDAGAEKPVKLLVLQSWCGRGILAAGTANSKLNVLKKTAQKHGVFIAAHGWVKEGNDLYSRCWLVDIRGEISLVQDQTHDKSGQLKLSDTLYVRTTALGTVGFLAGDDVWVPEVGRILRLQGADLFIAFSFLPAPLNPWQQWAGIWQQVQQNQVFALEASFNGQAGGRHFAGENIIHAPCEMTAGERGFLARDQEKGSYLAAALDYQALAQVRERYPLHRFYNTGFYQRALPQCYRG